MLEGLYILYIYILYIYICICKSMVVTTIILLKKQKNTIIFISGIITSSTLVYECLAILTCKPEVQRRLQAAVRTELGDAVPCLQDKARLPVVMATLYELLRLMSHVPLAIPHAATSDVTMGTYRIPKGGGVREIYIFFNTYNHKIHKIPSQRCPLLK